MKFTIVSSEFYHVYKLPYKGTQYWVTWGDGKWTMYPKLCGVRMSEAYELNWSNLMFNIFSLTETWLHNGMTDAEMGLTDHNIYRKYTDLNTSIFWKLGEFLFSFTVNIIAYWYRQKSSYIEQLFLLVMLKSNLVILAAYFPLKALLEIYFQFAGSIEETNKSYPKSKFLILADFILPSTKRENNVHDVQCVFEKASYNEIDEFAHS